ncbi:SDR family NAD(P)-dependent oxidoreductase [Saccharothrix obliqua]|uniref:SDR family NAD(P)-dependent oxidoreductase n=1 Tax=Saccharothrix obliqua TaxID=2861747 RepID=UPI001C5D63DE|nr:SDR family oxidoreductase [Saccharothrix obliqua]MBW4721293.1 SDR family oxidoreductase [Saccharothrix obliqua]
MELHNKLALITGATSGIGRETAKLFARQGATVVVHGRDAERGAKLVAEIEGDGGRARFVSADLTTLDGARALAADAGPVDILVNNAGIYPFAATVDQSREGFQEMFELNVLGPFHLTAALAPGMVAKGAGTIVNVSTSATVSAVPGSAAYSATKAALESLTRTWAAEFGPSGIRVNALAPSATKTDRVLNDFGPVADVVAESTALKRLAEVREMAEIILFLASERSSYITGELIMADAGRTVV